MRRIHLAAAAITLLLLLVVSALLVVSDPTPSRVASEDSQVVHQPAAQEKAGLRTLQARYKVLSRQLSQLMPNQPYILVDTARNRLYVKHQEQVVLNALASTGSGTILDKPGEGHSQWIFDTPRGEFLVKSKLTNPTWIKPDWAFVEEGLAVPTKCRRPCRAGGPRRICAGIRQRLFHPWDALYPFVGKKRDAWMHPAQ